MDFIQDERFQVELGKILGADVFSGNPDRMYGHVNPYAETKDAPVEAFVNTGNLIIKKKPGGRVKPIAIDNEFGFHSHWTRVAKRQELINTKTGLWGDRTFGSAPSLALAVGQLARKEAGLLFDHLRCMGER